MAVNPRSPKYRQRATEKANVKGNVKLTGTRAVRSRRPQEGQGNPLDPDWRAGILRAGINLPQDGHLLSYSAIVLE